MKCLLTRLQRDERGSSVVEPLIAVVLLIAALAPLAGAFARVAFSHDAEHLSRASLIAADAADRARISCAPLPTEPPRASWTVHVRPTEGVGVAAITADVVDANGRILSSISAPCLPR